MHTQKILKITHSDSSDLTEPIRPHSFQTHDYARDMCPILKYSNYNMNYGIKLALISTD